MPACARASPVMVGRPASITLRSAVALPERSTGTLDPLAGIVPGQGCPFTGHALAVGVQHADIHFTGFGLAFCVLCDIGLVSRDWLLRLHGFGIVVPEQHRHEALAQAPSGIAGEHAQGTRARTQVWPLDMDRTHDMVPVKRCSDRSSMESLYRRNMGYSAILA